MVIQDKANTLDIIKAISCVLIIGSHVLPIFHNETLNFYYGQWFFRFCVPLFFIVSGFYFNNMTKCKKWNYIRRIALLYIVSTVIYLPLFISTDIKDLVRNLIFGYYHLWYLSALTLGLVLVYCAERILNEKRFVVGLVLLVGIFFDEYYKLFSFGFLSNVVETMEYVGGVRHALFFAVPMLLMGEWISEKHFHESVRVSKTLIVFFIVWALAFVESTFLRTYLGDIITVDISFFGWMPACALVVFGLRTKINIGLKKSRFLRKSIDIVYIIHIWIIVIIEKFLGGEYLWKFILAIVISFGCAYVFQLCLRIIRDK